MKGDEFAEDLELPRRIDEDEDDEAASGPSLTPSGPIGGHSALARLLVKTQRRRGAGASTLYTLPNFDA